MITQSVSEARRKLGELIELARQGEDVVIIKDSKPVATLTPISDANLRFVPLSPAKMRRLRARIKKERGFTFPSVEAAVQSMKKQFRKRP